MTSVLQVKVLGGSRINAPMAVVVPSEYAVAAETFLLNEVKAEIRNKEVIVEYVYLLKYVVYNAEILGRKLDS